MIIRIDLQEAESAIAEIKKMALFINCALVGYTDESQFQKALEMLVAKHIAPEVESERIFPAFLSGVALRDVRNEIDLLVPVPAAVSVNEDMKGVLVVVELKLDGDLDGAVNQLLRYIVAVSKGGKPEWPVYHKGLVINFHPRVEVTDSEAQAPHIITRPDIIEVSASRLPEFIWSA